MKFTDEEKQELVDELMTGERKWRALDYERDGFLWTIAPSQVSEIHFMKTDPDNKIVEFDTIEEVDKFLAENEGKIKNIESTLEVLAAHKARIEEST